MIDNKNNRIFLKGDRFARFFMAFPFLIMTAIMVFDNVIRKNGLIEVRVKR